jgi:hypothetical protein
VWGESCFRLRWDERRSSVALFLTHRQKDPQTDKWNEKKEIRTLKEEVL